MKYKPSVVVVLAVHVLLSNACSEQVEPGLYLADSGQTGLVQVISDQEAYFFPNEGLLYSAPVTVVQLRKGSSKAEITLRDGGVLKANLETYEIPEFRRLSGISPYRNPKYQIREVRDTVYAHAKGFWDSYPGAVSDNALILFGRKTGDLLKMQDVELKMDIYSPIDDNAKSRPLLLLIHGGAFFNGNKEEEALVNWARYFASLGYVVSSIDYRLGFRPTLNEVDRAGYRAVQDANAAVRFLLEQESLSVDPRLVFVAGTSAGGITALNLAYMQDKDRPRITRGGRLGDEGTIESITPPGKHDFSVRAVANLWGAVRDTTMLYNARIPVISFQSESDPIVPFKVGHPFEKLLDFGTLGDIVSWVWSIAQLDSPIQFQLGRINELIFPEMYGAFVIDQVLQHRGVHSELHSSLGERHSLHLNDADEIIPSSFKEIQDGMEAFFSSEMATCPVSLRQVSPNRFMIDVAEVDKCYWKVEGGIILDQRSDSIEILLMSGPFTHAVTVSGLYKSGLAFVETIKLD